jgi:hypothetical protein
MSKTIKNLEKLLLAESQKTNQPIPTEEEFKEFYDNWDHVSAAPERLKIYGVKRWIEEHDKIINTFMNKLELLSLTEKQKS